MLHAVSNEYDSHRQLNGENSIDALTASLNDGKAHLLLACSGSVATIKLPNIIQALSQYPSSRLSIRVILTPSASRFLAGQSAEQPSIQTLRGFRNVDAVDEWKVPWVRGDGILHIELRRWADILVIAPLSANTLAKITGGFSDSLLASVVRAWDPWGELDTNTGPSTTNTTTAAVQDAATMTQEGAGTESAARGNRRHKKRHIIVAPAMNTAMWRHPITAKQLRVLEEEWGIAAQKETHTDANTDTEMSTAATTTLTETEENPSSREDGWFEVLRPQRKVLACGDAGDGAMIEWTRIVAVIEERLGLKG